MRRAIQHTIPLLILAAAIGSCGARGPERRNSDPGITPSSPEKIVKSDEEWKAELTPEQFRVTRQAATERAFTGKYWNAKDAGTYHCVCCGEELFSSSTKYESGCGWPSFYDEIQQGNIITRADHSTGMLRTEIVCQKCDAHLGHVFEDGPEPTGLRYCVNSASMTFRPAQD